MMTKEQIKEAAKAVIEAEKAVKDAYKALEAVQSVFTEDYRKGYDKKDGLLGEVNLIEVDGEYWELVIDVEDATFQHLRRSSYSVF
jgi:hypothetical protein